MTPSRLCQIAIVGRPNVGKSTLANRMAHTRVSIVEPTSGVTRDRVALPVRLPTPWGERHVLVLDTGGIGIVDRDDLGAHVEAQVHAALLAADVVLFLVDARDGLTPLDHEVARRLRGFKKPVLLVVNKVEGNQQRWEIESFRELGMQQDPIPISAQNGEGLGPLYERIAMLLPAQQSDERLPTPALKLAVVGRRNAGKSSLINAFAREERVIVSEVPGTTRDALDILISRDGEDFTVIDTAGIRKKKSHEDAIDFYSDSRSHKAIRRADVTVLLFDATVPLSSIEKRLARYISDHHKPVILGVNKWDLVSGREPEDYEDYLQSELPGLSFSPVSFLSAKTGWHVWETLALARDLDRQARMRVSTGELNRVLKSALETRSPSSDGHRVRIMYATQAETVPPTFVLFVNDKRLIGKDYLRYLENRLREAFDFREVPLHLVLRDKERETSSSKDA